MAVDFVHCRKQIEIKIFLNVHYINFLTYASPIIFATIFAELITPGNPAPG